MMKAAFTLLRFLLRSSPARFLCGVGLGLLTGAISTGFLALINAALGGGPVSRAKLLIWFVVLASLRLATGAASRVLVVAMSQSILLELRVRLCARIITCPLQEIELIGQHRLLANLGEDIVNLSNASNQLTPLCINLVVLCGCLAYLSWLSWPVCLCVLFFMVVGSFGFLAFQGAAVARFRGAREGQDKTYHCFRGLCQGLKQLKLSRSRRKSFMDRQLLPAAMSVRRQSINGGAIYALASEWGYLTFIASIAVLVFALPTISMIDHKVLIGSVVTVFYLVGPLEALLGSIPLMARAGVSLAKIQDIGVRLAESSSYDSGPDAPPKASPVARLELNEVTYAYDADKTDAHFQLGPLSLSFYPGELCFLVGGNGSGKTTLAKLITGLYEPQAGQIRLNGELITPANYEWYREHFAAVFSEFWLFDTLPLLDSRSLEERVQKYLVRFQLQKHCDLRDPRFTPTSLSHGQRKRLALLSALLEDRPVYLFDEWAADQDPTFKQVFYQQLLPELKSSGKTVLVITHDEQYFHLADRVLALDYGQVQRDCRGHPKRP